MAGCQLDDQFAIHTGDCIRRDDEPAIGLNSERAQRALNLIGVVNTQRSHLDLERRAAASAAFRMFRLAAPRVPA